MAGQMGSITKRVGLRKRSPNQIYYRSMSVYYNVDQGVLRFKALLQENTQGQMDHAIETLATEMRAVRVDTRRYWQGEDARLQLMADSMSHLVGFAPGSQPYEKIRLFQGHLEALKGKHVFQGMGDLYKLEQAIPALEPMLCDECGERVNQQDLDFGTPFANQQISPTSEHYVWRDHQRQHRPPPPPEQGELGLVADD
jgi:hypothetical protein